MRVPPANVRSFLDESSIAVIGVSRSGKSPGNIILGRLRETGHAAWPVNPAAADIGGERCWPDPASIPEPAGAAVITVAPDRSASVVRQCAAAGIRKVWLHRSVGRGSISDEALREAERLGVEVIAGGCPMMYAGEVDIAHRCMRWLLRWDAKLRA